MRKFIFLAFLLFTSVGVSQENWVWLQTDLTGEYDLPNNAIPMVNEANGKVAIFLQLRRKARAFYIDENQNISNEVSLDKMPKRERNYLGFTINQNRYKLYFSDNAVNTLSSVTLNFGNNTFEIIEEELEIEKEHVIGSFFDDKALHVLTLPKKSNYFKLYRMEEKGLVDIKKIQVPPFTFFNNDQKEIRLSKLLTWSDDSRAEYIIPNEPISIEIASKNNKLYWDKNNELIYLTADFYNSSTYIFKMDINAISCDVKKFDHPTIDESNFNLSSNSFILGESFFSFIANRKIAKLGVYDLESLTKIKNYSIDRDQQITFKNTPVYQLYNGVEKENEIEKTRKFLRKITAQNVGVSAYTSGENYIISLGGTQQVTSGYSGPLMPLGGFGLGGGVFAGITYSFISYTTSNSIYFNSYLNTNFDHVQEEIPSHPYESVVEFNRELGMAVKVPTIFKYKEDYIWGAFMKSNGFYRMAIFSK